MHRSKDHPRSLAPSRQEKNNRQAHHTTDTSISGLSRLPLHERPLCVWLVRNSIMGSLFLREVVADNPRHPERKRLESIKIQTLCVCCCCLVALPSLQHTHATTPQRPQLLRLTSIAMPGRSLSVCGGQQMRDVLQVCLGSCRLWLVGAHRQLSLASYPSTCQVDISFQNPSPFLAFWCCFVGGCVPLVIPCRVWFTRLDDSCILDDF